jgi:hypothetical protein
MAVSPRGRTGQVRYLGLLGSTAFVAGFVIAILGGIWWEDADGIKATLVIFGLIVGLLNITGREVIPYLVATIALVLIGQADPPIFESLNTISDDLAGNLNDIVAMLALFAAPAAIVNALRAAVALARPGQTE